MKKVFLMASLIAATFTSCSSDDDVSSENNSPIVGKWQLVSSIANGIDETDDCDRKDNVEFRGDNSFTDIYFNTTQSTIDMNGQTEVCSETIEKGTYAIDGNKLTRNVIGDDETYTVLFKVENNNLIFTDDDVIDTYKRIN